jgi:hypothetical protein
MKNYHIFRGYFTKTVFDKDTQKFEERCIEHENYDDSPHIDSPHMIAEAPLDLTFMMVGLQRPAKRIKRY